MKMVDFKKVLDERREKQRTRDGKHYDVFEFGRQLLEARDLDPVYTLVWFTPELAERQRLYAWLVAYWGFYHTGTAGWITDALEESEDAYWDRFRMAAESKEYPRGSERRHFRAKNAVDSYEFLSQERLPGLWNPLLRMNNVARPTTCKDVMEEVKRWVGFGPWIAFKVADMLERLNIVPVEFNVSDVYLFDSPKKAAKILWDEIGDGGEGPSDVPGGLNPWAVTTVLKRLEHHAAPPRDERPFGVQEAETVLCKWKSYLNGKYKVGEDVAHNKTALRRFVSKSPIARSMFRAGNQNLWSTND